MNKNNTLPLRKPQKIAVIGSDMGPSTRGPNFFDDRGGLEGTLGMGWGSGTTNFPYLVDPLQGIMKRARKDQTSVSWWLRDWDEEGAARVAMSADVAIVGIASDSGEGFITVEDNAGDRANLSAWNNGDNLVLAVAAANARTVVVVHSVGPMDVERWVAHPNVSAVLWAGLPGQESGNALADVLYGHSNPSGRLPYTIARSQEDYPAHIDFADAPDASIPYTEGLLIDYRHFLAKGIEPRFPFGFGLSYTEFEYERLEVRPVSNIKPRARAHGGGGANGLREDDGDGDEEEEEDGDDEDGDDDYGDGEHDHARFGATNRTRIGAFLARS